MTALLHADLLAIAGAISESAESPTGPFKPLSAIPIGASADQRIWQITDGLQSYFVKTGTLAAKARFAAESHCLQAMAETDLIATPTAISSGETDTQAFLVLEFLDLAALDAKSGARLGEALARLHRISCEHFGWHEDNFIGATPQRNTAHLSWPFFFGDRRLRPQIELALARGMSKPLAEKALGVVERIGGFFVDYQPVPSLLHGDLWSGNAAQRGNGDAIVYDPACYYGDRETDIAMAELFGGFPSAFFAAYRAAWPLDTGYEMRKPLYNLYHILNHFNLFGSAYLGQAQRMIDGLLSALKR